MSKQPEVCYLFVIGWYLNLLLDADGGVPVNFFVSRITKKDVIRQWMKEFRPDLYNFAMRGENPFDKSSSE